MKKLFSYLFLTAGIGLALLLGGCLHGPAPIKPASHVMYSTTNAVHVSLVGNVSDYQYEYYQKTLLYMKANSIKDLHVHLFSPGGSAVAMVAIIDLLDIYKDTGIHITTYNNGACMSAAVPLFLTGDVRIMRPNAVIMIHSLRGVPDKEFVSISAWEAFERLKYFYADIVLRKTSMTATAIMKCLDPEIEKNDTYFFAFEALKLGFATEIR